MSLSLKERHALESIEKQLAKSDHKLATMLDTFLRLTAGEAMPKRERLRSSWLRAFRASDRRHYRPAAAVGPASRKRARLLMVLWVVISLLLVAFAAVTGRAGPGSCAVPSEATCPARLQPHGAHQAAAPLWLGPAVGRWA